MVVCTSDQDVIDLAVCLSDQAVCVSDVAVCVSDVAVCVSDVAICVSDLAVCVSDLPVCVSDVAICVSDVAVCVSDLAVCVSDVVAGDDADVDSASVYDEEELATKHRQVTNRQHLQNKFNRTCEISSIWRKCKIMFNLLIHSKIYL